MNSGDQTKCAVCERPVPAKEVICPYCGEDIPHHPAWLFARRVSPWLLAIGIAAAALVHRAALRADLASTWRMACDSTVGKLLLAISLGLAIAPPASGSLACERDTRRYAWQAFVGLASAAWGFLLPYSPRAAWIPLFVALLAQTGIRATRDIEPWRILPAALVPLAVIF